MARPLRDVRAMPQYPPLEAIGAGVDGAQVTPQWVPLCWPPSGMDLTNAPNNLGPGRPEAILNLVPWPDSWRQRAATSIIGVTPAANIDIATKELIYARQVYDAGGREWLVRWHTAGVDVLVSGVWVDCTGPTLTMTRYTKIAMTGWNNLIIFSDGASGMYALDMNARSYALISGAPAAGHLTTFNTRIIASVPNTSRIQWCVARDYTDWTSTDLGAGYEDLLSAPDGSVDRQTAVLPISDEIAYCVRSNSIWQMEPTRNLAAPFAFSRVIGSLGSRWAPACTAIPGGIAFMNDRGVYLLRGGQVEDLTPPIDPLFRATDQATLRSAWMVYDAPGQCIRLLGAFTEERFDYIQSDHLVLRWNFRIGGGWSADRYFGMDPVSISAAIDFRERGTIGELTGTIGDLEGVVGDLLVSSKTSGVLFVMRSSSAPPFAKNWVARESDGAVTGWSASGLVGDGAPFVLLTSGALRTDDASRLTQVIGVSMVMGTPFYTSGTPTRLANITITTRGRSAAGSSGQIGVATLTHTSNDQERVLLPIVGQAYAAQFRFVVLTSGGTSGPLYLYDLRARVVDGALMGEKL